MTSSHNRVEIVSRRIVEYVPENPEPQYAVKTSSSTSLQYWPLDEISLIKNGHLNPSKYKRFLNATPVTIEEIARRGIKSSSGKIRYNLTSSRSKASSIPQSRTSSDISSNSIFKSNFGPVISEETYNVGLPEENGVLKIQRTRKGDKRYMFSIEPNFHALLELTERSKSLMITK